MKCPILSGITFTKEEGVYHHEVDCLQEECPVWLEDVSLCGIKDIALELRYIQQRLADMADKMPHEQQFRK